MVSLKTWIWVFIMAFASFNVSGRVYTGLEVFLSKYTHLVKGKRVGLITNPTGVDPLLRPTVDLLRASPNVNLVALFAPEHGIRGDVRAGDNVAGGKDSITGLPVFTLYGGVDHKPRKSHLAKVDVLIYDIQDVGSRSYTYIWHLAECMSACAAVKKMVIVLDRPNPLGAMVIDGPVMEKKYLSFIGLYPIPRVYGLTVGELAHYLNIEEGINCPLRIVPMLNYKRGMSWEQTGLPWVPTSPYIPSPQSACCFAATGTIGELGIINVGIGYTLPFQTIASPWMNAEKSAALLNRLRLPGVIFRPIHFKPFYGLYHDKDVEGVQIHVTQPAVFRPSTTEVAILCHLRDCYPKNFQWTEDKDKMFDKAMGTDSVRLMIQAGKNLDEITRSWLPALRRYQKERVKYLIYK